MHEQESSLVTLNLDGGLEGFKAALGKVHLPPDRRQWKAGGKAGGVPTGARLS